MTIDTMTIDIVVGEIPTMMIETITMIQVTMMDTKVTTNCDGVVPLVNVNTAHGLPCVLGNSQSGFFSLYIQ